MKNVSCESDRWVVETQLRKLRNVRHAHWACLFYIQFVIRCLWIKSTIWLILSSAIFKVGRSRVLCIFLMKDLGRWIPWVLPGSTGQFYKDDTVHNHSAHGYYILVTRMEGGVRYAWYCYMLSRIKQNQAKTVMHIIIVRELNLVTFHMKYNLNDGTSKINVRMITRKN